MSNPAKEILVLGLGLIGSSLAKAAKNKGLIVHGIDEDKSSVEEEVNKNIIQIRISSKTFHCLVKPKKTSEWMVVMKAIGIKILKNILREKENDDKGNLPI